MSEWLVMLFGDESQYRGNPGYDDELASTYRYDSFVPNHTKVTEGDVLAIRDKRRLLGIARIETIESVDGVKQQQRCPACAITKIKARRTKSPRFRCEVGHEFEQPKTEEVPATLYEARFGSTFTPVSRPLTGAEVRQACPNFNARLSMQTVDLTKLGIPNLGDLIGSAVMLSSTHQQLGDEYRPANERIELGQTDPFERDPKTVERGLLGHARTQNLLAEWADSAGHEPRSPKFDEPNFDLAWEANGVNWIAEVKSTTPFNEERQLRLGLGQVLRYRHLMSKSRCVRACLVLERQPRDESWIELCGTLDVVLTWAPTFPGLVEGRATR